MKKTIVVTRKLAGFLAAVALLTLPVSLAAWADVPVCPPVEEEGVWMCVDGEAVQMEGRFSVGVALHMWDFDDGTQPFLPFIPFARFGYEAPVWDNMFLRSGLSVQNLFTPFFSWYIIDVGGKYHLTENLSATVGLDFLVGMKAGRVHDESTWRMNVGGYYSFGGLGPGLGIFLQGSIPFQVRPRVPLFGAYFSGGLEFRF